MGRLSACSWLVRVDFLPYSCWSLRFCVPFIGFKILFLSCQGRFLLLQYWDALGLFIRNFVVKLMLYCMSVFNYRKCGRLIVLSQVIISLANMYIDLKWLICRQPLTSKWDILLGIVRNSQKLKRLYCTCIVLALLEIHLNSFYNHPVVAFFWIQSWYANLGSTRIGFHNHYVN